MLRKQRYIKIEINQINTKEIHNINSYLNRFEYERIGHETLQSCGIEWTMASLLM